MSKIKIIVSFILLVSLFLGVVACTPDEESKADVSEDVLDVVSEAVSDEESYPPITEDATSIVGENQITVELYNDEAVMVYTEYDDKTLYFVELGKNMAASFNEHFYKKYGYECSFDEDASEARELLYELFETEIKKLINSGIVSAKNIYTDKDYWDVRTETISERRMPFSIMVLANEDEVQALNDSNIVSKVSKWDEHLHKINDDKWKINTKVLLG